MALTLEQADFTYGLGQPYAVPAVRGASITLEPGTLTLLVGATGSGKTTMMRLLAGLLAPDAGAAKIDGQPLRPELARGTVGLIFQDAESQLFADTVLDDVEFGPRNLGVPSADATERARDALRAVGLDPHRYSDRSPFSLSGGEARRAAIAGVLAMRPRYLLADEPTAGLDAPGRAAVRALLLAQRSQSAVLVVSHAAEEFLSGADFLAVIVDGRLAWNGAAKDARNDPGVMTRLGLRAPDVLEVQRLAAERGARAGHFTLDAVAAASALAGAAGWPR